MSTIIPYSGARWQHGYGLAAVFRGLFGTIMPLAKSAGQKVLKAGLRTGVGLGSEVLRGKDMSQALHHRVSGALREVAGPAVTGSNRKRKAPSRKGHPPTKRVRGPWHGKATGKGSTPIQGGDIFSRWQALSMVLWIPSPRTGPRKRTRRRSTTTDVYHDRAMRHYKGRTLPGPGQRLKHQGRVESPSITTS